MPCSLLEFRGPQAQNHKKMDRRHFLHLDDLDPSLANWQQAYDGDNCARLQRVKKAVDPDRVPSMPQGIVPAA